MIAKTTSSSSFFPLAAYLAAGTDARHPERVEWTVGRHLAVADLTVAAAIMEATAYRSVRVELPCYHVVVSFDTRDQPTRAEMEEVADRVLGRLGLAEYQALLVAHNDRPCAHVHVMVNRVHPETGLAWERWKDRHVIETVLRESERDFGMRQVPGRLSPALDTEHRIPPARKPDLTWSERRLAARTGREPLLDRARDALSECRRARSWREIGAVLALRGLVILCTTKGIVISDGHTRVKASRVAPDLGLPRLEARFAERLSDSITSPGVERIVALVRQLLAGEAVERDARKAATALQHANAELMATHVVGRQRHALIEQLPREFAHVYADPYAARSAFHTLERDRGTAYACALLADTPEQLGTLRTARTPRPLRSLARGVNAVHQAVARLSRLAGDVMRTAEVAGAMLPEPIARAHVESVSAHARRAREALALHRSRGPNTGKLREQLAFEVGQLDPENARAFQGLLLPTDVGLMRSSQAEGRDAHDSQERSRG